MRFLCEHCDARLDTEHYWRGFSVTCPNCGRQTKLDYRLGQNIPNTGYTMTFRDFAQLLSATSSSQVVDPVIRDLLKCEIERTGAALKLIHADGSFIPLEAAHFAIQLDENARGIIYNVAMNLWR
jgi:hypothetical protein